MLGGWGKAGFSTFSDDLVLFLLVVIIDVCFLVLMFGLFKIIGLSLFWWSLVECSCVASNKRLMIVDL